MFIAALCTIAKTWKQTKCSSIDEWIKKMELLSHKKKNEITPFSTTWIDLEVIMLSEVSQKEKDKYHVIAYMWNLKKK